MSERKRGFLCYVFLEEVMREDCGAFAADCIVLSCCCECLVLQVIILIVLKIPRKIAQKMKKYVRRRLRGRKRRDEKIFGHTPEKNKEERWSDNGFAFDESQRFRCMEEVEGMLQELSTNGEFVFGSFWGRGASSDILDFSVLRCEITKTKITPYCCCSLQELCHRIKNPEKRTEHRTKGIYI